MVERTARCATDCAAGRRLAARIACRHAVDRTNTPDSPVGSFALSRGPDLRCSAGRITRHRNSPDARALPLRGRLSALSACCGVGRPGHLARPPKSDRVAESQPIGPRLPLGPVRPLGLRELAPERPVRGRDCARVGGTLDAPTWSGTVSEQISVPTSNRRVHCVTAEPRNLSEVLAQSPPDMAGRVRRPAVARGLTGDSCAGKSTFRRPQGSVGSIRRAGP